MPENIPVYAVVGMVILVIAATAQTKSETVAQLNSIQSKEEFGVKLC